MFSLSPCPPMSGAAKATLSPQGSWRTTSNQQQTNTLHTGATASSRLLAQKSPWSRLFLNYVLALSRKVQLDMDSLYIQMTKGQDLHPYFASAYQYTCSQLHWMLQGTVIVSTLNALSSFVILLIQNFRKWQLSYITSLAWITASRSQLEPTDSLQDLGKTVLLKGEAFWNTNLLVVFFSPLNCIPSALYSTVFFSPQQAKNCCFTRITLIMRVTRRADPDTWWYYGNLHLQKANVHIPTTYQHLHNKFQACLISCLLLLIFAMQHFTTTFTLSYKKISSVRPPLCALDYEFSTAHPHLCFMVHKMYGFHIAFCLGTCFWNCLPIFSLCDVAYFISMEGIFFFQTPRFESMLYFARGLADFIIMACLKWKNVSNNYLFFLL